MWPTVYFAFTMDMISAKVFAGMPSGGFAMNLPCFDIQRCVKRQCSVAIVFKAMFFRSPWRQRKHRIETIQDLNRRLFIDAEDCCMLRRVHVQSDDSLLVSARTIQNTLDCAQQVAKLCRPTGAGCGLRNL